MQKKTIKYIVLGAAALTFLIITILGLSMLMEYTSKGEGSKETVTIEIEQGEGTQDIAAKLQDKGLINHKLVFYLKVKNMGALLRFGTFEIPKDAGLEHIIHILASGGALKEETMFTVPEGYTIEMIAQKLENEGICSESDFLEAVEQDYDYWFIDEIPEDADVKYKLQGFLFPETYAIGEDMTAKDIVNVMLNQFDKQFTEEMLGKLKVQRKTVYDIVIEASIIERETVLDSERAMVAGVIKNRLNINMKLQMCPTALYPVTNGIYDKTTVTKEDTKVDSPYNTYENYGLPVGPIANPGLESLKAALEPAEHDYLYYHVDPKKNDGSHIFTKNYQDHLNTQ